MRQDEAGWGRMRRDEAGRLKPQLTKGTHNRQTLSNFLWNVQKNQDVVLFAGLLTYVLGPVNTRIVCKVSVTVDQLTRLLTTSVVHSTPLDSIKVPSILDKNITSKNPSFSDLITRSGSRHLVKRSFCVTTLPSARPCGGPLEHPSADVRF